MVKYILFKDYINLLISLIILTPAFSLSSLYLAIYTMFFPSCYAFLSSLYIQNLFNMYITF